LGAKIERRQCRPQKPTETKKSFSVFAEFFANSLANSFANTMITRMNLR
jgi:hypothetical protein